MRLFTEVFKNPLSISNKDKHRKRRGKSSISLHSIQVRRALYLGHLIMFGVDEMEKFLAYKVEDELDKSQPQ